MDRPKKDETIDPYGGPTNDYPPDLYLHSGIAQGVDRFSSVTEDEIERFHEEGYLVINNAFSADEVKDTMTGFMDLLAGVNPEFNGVQYEGMAGIIPSDLSLESKQDTIRKFMRFVDYDSRLKDLSQHPELLALLARIIGEKPQLFQDMALFKPPRIGRDKPWHQDLAYFDVPLTTTIVGVWIALDEATPQNGCMRIIPGSHREGPVVHFSRRDWQICDTAVHTKETIAVPLKPGGCLLFHCLLQHGTPINATSQRRRAVQFHYQPASAGAISEEERLAVFGSEGKDVTC